MVEEEHNTAENIDMTQRLILCLLTCGPILLTLASWIRIYSKRQRPRPVALIALGVVTSNAALAAGTFLYYELRPSPWQPPWKDPEILRLALLFLLAPIGMILGLIAGLRGAPKWLICIVEIASLPLLVVGFFACAAV
jgi:hypothetical protein